ncbi:MAG: MFS transporter, partial [Ktedonobacteraceae bacterium]|nr:MFS transporter [Ktedonobacteraceae bacterium]
TSLPYMVHLLLLMPTLLGVWMMPKTIPRQPGRQKRPIPSSRLSVLNGSPFALGSVTAFVAWAVIALFVALAPTYVAIFLHVQDLMVIGGVVFLLLGASTVTQALLRELPAQRAIVTGIVLLLLGLGSVIIAVPMHSLALLLAGMIANGIGHGLAWMGSLAFVTLTAPSSRRGEILARFYVVMYLGVGLPVIGVGFLTAWIGLYGAIAFFAGTVGIMGVSLAVFISKVPPECIAPCRTAGESEDHPDKRWRGENR